MQAEAGVSPGGAGDGGCAAERRARARLQTRPEEGERAHPVSLMSLPGEGERADLVSVHHVFGLVQ